MFRQPRGVCREESEGLSKQTGYEVARTRAWALEPVCLLNPGSAAYLLCDGSP